MINLLPPEDKRQLRAARTNSLLVRYNILLLGVAVFLAVAIGLTYILLSNSKSTAEQQMIENQAKAAQYAEVERKAQLFRSNLTTAKQILDAEVNYSSVLLKIAAVMPSGTILDRLNLDASTFGTPTTFVAQVRDYDTALRLKAAFENSDLFTDVNFQSITATTGGQTAYPLNVTLNVTIKKEVASQ
jgi:Tfp pilus assembly protein PilN